MDFEEPNVELDRIAHEVIGAAIEVHKALGPGFLESVYEEALAIEFDQRLITYSKQYVVAVLYKGRFVGENRLDFLVRNSLVLELKAVESLLPIHTAQTISYLKALKLPLGLLINFNVSVLKQGIKRVVLS